MEGVVDDIADDQNEAMENPGTISDSMIALNKNEESRSKA